MKALFQDRVKITPIQFHALCLAFADQRDDLDVLAKNQADGGETTHSLPIDTHRVELWFSYHRVWGFYVTATWLADDQTQLRVTPDEVRGSVDAWEAFFCTVWGELLNYISQIQPITIGQRANSKTTLLEQAPKPGGDGYTWDDFFDWCYRQPRHITVDEMAKMTGDGKRTVERHKSAYEAQYGKQAIPNAESKFSDKTYGGKSAKTGG